MKPTPHHSKRQSGLVLLIALIALAALSMAGLGLMRAITADSAIAANLAFRQSTINTGDTGIDSAVSKVISELIGNDSGTGHPYSWADQGSYYKAAMLVAENPKAGTLCATSDLNCIKTSGIPNRLLADVSPRCTSTGNTSYGYTLYNADSGNCAYVFIDRLCTSAGEATANNCVLLSSEQSDSGKYTETHAGGEAGDIKLQGNKVAVRVSVRIDGPRGTTTYLQALVGQLMT